MSPGALFSISVTEPSLAGMTVNEWDWLHKMEFGASSAADRNYEMIKPIRLVFS